MAISQGRQIVNDFGDIVRSDFHYQVKSFGQEKSSLQTAPAPLEPKIYTAACQPSHETSAAYEPLLNHIALQSWQMLPACSPAASRPSMGCIGSVGITMCSQAPQSCCAQYPAAAGCGPAATEHWPCCGAAGIAGLPTPSFAALQRCPSSCAAQSAASAAATAAAFEPFWPLAGVGGAAADPFHDDWKHW